MNIASFKHYLKLSHKYLKKHQVLYVYCLLTFLLSFIPSVFTTYQIDPLFLFSLASICFGYLWISSLILLPVILYRHTENQKITFVSITRIILKYTKKLLIFLFYIFSLFLLTVLLGYIVFDVLLHMPFIAKVFEDTTKIVGFGFYPQKALFMVGGFLIVVPLYFFQIHYFLENRNVWNSVKRTLHTSKKSIDYLIPFVIIYVLYTLPLYLFVPDGNYYVRFFTGILDTYLSVIFTTAFYLFYKERHTLEAVTHEQIKKKVKLNFGGKFAIAAGYIIFAELALLFFFGFLDELGMIHLASDNSAFIYLLLAVLIPLSTFFIKYSKFSIKKLLLFPGLSFVVFLIVFSMFIYAVPTEPTTPQPVNQLFTADELWEAINDKREEYGTSRLAKNEWACTAADIELQSNVRVGNGEFTSTESFKLAVEETQDRYKRTATDTSDKLPIFLFEYVTYGFTLDETIAAWEKSGSKLLFLDKEYTLGCVAVKDGYGVVVTGKDFIEGVTENINI